MYKHCNQHVLAEVSQLRLIRMSCWQYGSAAVDASRTAHLPSSSDHIARSFLCDAFDASGAELFTEQNLKDTFAVTAERAQTSGMVGGALRT